MLGIFKIFWPAVRGFFCTIFPFFSLFCKKRHCLSNLLDATTIARPFVVYEVTFFTSFSKDPRPKKSKGEVMMLSKSKWRRPYFLTFYVKDNQLHLMLPLVFFLGLFEAFMSKTFLMVSALISNFL